VELARSLKVTRGRKRRVDRAAEKRLSRFESQTPVIQRHKPGQPVEFGRQGWLDEVEGGRPNASARSGAAGGGAACAFGGAARGGSAGGVAALNGTAAGSMEPRGWAAGWAGAFSPTL